MNVEGKEGFDEIYNALCDNKASFGLESFTDTEIKAALLDEIRAQVNIESRTGTFYEMIDAAYNEINNAEISINEMNEAKKQWMDLAEGYSSVGAQNAGKRYLNQFFPKEHVSADPYTLFNTTDLADDVKGTAWVNGNAENLAKIMNAPDFIGFVYDSNKDDKSGLIESKTLIPVYEVEGEKDPSRTYFADEYNAITLLTSSDKFIQNQMGMQSFEEMQADIDRQAIDEELDIEDEREDYGFDLGEE